jgi:hypothetical protein
MDVIVRPTKINEWLGFFKWSGCFHYLGSYIMRSGNRYTGLSEDVRIRLERELGYPPGHLNHESPFWDTFIIKIGNEDLVFSVDTPLNELKYHFLFNHKNVAKDINHVTKNHDFVLIDQTVEAAEVNKLSEKRRDCYKYFEKMSHVDRCNFLRIVGINTNRMAMEVVEMKCNEIIDTDPDKFILHWIKNKDREMHSIIAMAVELNILKVKNNYYYFATEVIGVGVEEVTRYLLEPSNKAILESIKNETDAKLAQKAVKAA